MTLSNEDLSKLLVWAYKRGFTDGTEVVQAAVDGAMHGLESDALKIEQELIPRVAEIMKNGQEKPENITDLKPC